MWTGGDLLSMRNGLLSMCGGLLRVVMQLSFHRTYLEDLFGLLVRESQHEFWQISLHFEPETGECVQTTAATEPLCLWVCETFKYYSKSHHFSARSGIPDSVVFVH